MSLLKVGLCQMDIKSGEKETNLRSTEKLINRFPDEVDFVCLPEYFTTGSVPNRFRELGEPIPGKTTEKLKEIAQNKNTYITGSFVEKTEKNLFNTAVIIGPEGKLLTKYRKINLFIDERRVITPGREKPPTIDTEHCKIGLITCYDAIFPETTRELLKKDAEIVFIPSNWPEPFIPAWKIATSARALENQFWTIAVNRVGETGEFRYFGKSRATDPYGKTKTEMNNKQATKTIEIDLKKSDKFKDIVNFKEDLRRARDKWK